MLKKLAKKPPGLSVDDDHPTLFLQLCYETGEPYGNLALEINGDECYPHINIPKEGRCKAAYAKLKEDLHKLIIPELIKAGVTNLVTNNTGVGDPVKFRKLVEYLGFPHVQELVVAGWEITDGGS